MDSPLSLFSSPEDYPFSFDSFDGYPSSPPASASSFNLHGNGAFASLGGLAKQLCTIEPSSAFSVGSDRSPASSTFDDLVKDLDFSSDDDWFSPLSHYHDLPTPLARDSYVPLTPPTFDDFLAPELVDASAGQASSAQGGGGFACGLDFLAQPSYGQQQQQQQGPSLSTSASDLQQWLVDEVVDGSDSAAWPASSSSSHYADAASSKAPASYEVNVASWDTPVDSYEPSWAADPSYSQAPVWVESEVEYDELAYSPTTTTNAPSSYATLVPRPAQRARSNPSLASSASQFRPRLPPKASMPALREEFAVDGYEYIFDGGAQPAMQQSPSMFAVLGGYGGEQRSLGQAWEGSTVGSEMYGGGWQGTSGFVAPTLERFEVGQHAMREDRSMAGPSTSVLFSPPRYSRASSSQLSYAPTTSSFSSLSYPPAQPIHTFAPPSPSSSRPKTADSHATPNLPGPPRRASSASHVPTPASCSSKVKRTGTVVASPITPGAPMPAGMSRAHALVQMRQAEQERAREAYQKVKKEQAPLDATAASVLIQGWEPSSTTASASASTPRRTSVAPAPSSSKAMAKVPSATRSVSTASSSSHSSPTLSPKRPIASLPRKTSKARLVSAPAASSSSSAARPSASPKAAHTSAGWEPPAFQWGETTFINYTCDDAEHLLTGVAPSGTLRKPSAPKRKADDHDGARKKGRSA